MSAITDASGVPQARADEAYPSAQYAWYVVGILVVVYVFSFVDRLILNLMVAPIRRDLQISDTEISLLSGFSFALFYAVLGVPISRIADSGCRRCLIAGGFVVWSVFTAACGLARSFGQLLLMRVGVGVGEATLNPAAYSLITDYFPPERRATALGLYNMGIYVGAGIAFILGGLVIGLTASREEYVLPVLGAVRSWQLVFFLVGVPGLVFALAMFTVAEPRRRGPGADVASIPLGEVFTYIKMNRSTFASHNIATALLAFAAYGAAAWIPSFFIRQHGLTAAETGQMLGVLTILSAFGCVCGGWLADQLAKRGYPDACMRVLLLASLLALPTGVAYLLVPTVALSAALLAPTFFINAMVFGVAPAALMEFTPSRMRGQASALYLFAVNLIGLGIGPTAVAFITDFVFRNDNMVGYSLLIVTITAHILAASIYWAGLKPFVRSKIRLSETAITASA
jgi:MFS family permease